MVQSPMISCPLKQTNEIDWIRPLKDYIRQSYGEDPDRYSSECATLNRLRQDMRGAGKDSATGRDLLYRYYGQLELLDLRFPVDENHIKISFTWYYKPLSSPVPTTSFKSANASIPHTGMMPLPRSPLRNTPWHSRKHRSSLTSPPFCHATRQTRIALKIPVSKPRITLSRHPLACSHISMRISSTRRLPT